MLFIALRSWTNLHPWPLRFLTGKMGKLQGSIRDNEALSLVILYYGLYTLKGFLQDID